MSRVTASVTALLLAAGLATAQFWGTIGYRTTSYDIPPGGFLQANVGSRGMAMGGCYVATTKGCEALLRNPAALSLTEKTEVVLGGRAVAFGSIRDEMWKQASLDVKEEFGVNPKLWDVSIASEIPMEGKLSIGAALGWQAFYDNSLTVIMSGTRQGSQQKINIKSLGGYHVLAPGVGICYDGRWAAGLSKGWPVFSRSGGRVEYVPEVMGNPNLTVAGDMNGSVTQLGFLAKPVSGLSIGLCYTSALNLSLEDVEMVPDSGTAEPWSDVSYEIPEQFVVGVAYDIGPSFTAAGELGNMPLKHIRVNGSRLGINDGVLARLGGEWRTKVAVRAGVSLENYYDLAKPESKTPATLIVITGGVGAPLGPVKLDLGIECGMSDIKYSSPEDSVNLDLATDVFRAGLNLTYAWQLFRR